MPNMQLKTRLPMYEHEGTKVIVMIGTPLLELGQTVNVRDLSQMLTHRDLAIKDTHVMAICDAPDWVLAVSKSETFSHLRQKLTDATGIPLPAETEITVVVLTDVGASDILPLKRRYPGEWDEDYGDDLG